VSESLQENKPAPASEEARLERLDTLIKRLENDESKLIEILKQFQKERKTPESEKNEEKKDGHDLH
jgi:exonuclease VII small subunit